MPLFKPSKRVLGLVSALLFLTFLLGLYNTLPASAKPSITDKLNLNHPNSNPNLDPINQASDPPTESQPTDVNNARVLPKLLTLHSPNPNAPATYARLTRLADTSLLLSFTTVQGPQRILTVKRSVDEGQTFEPWGEVTRCEGDCGNLFLLELPATATHPAKLLAAFRNHDFDATHHITYFRITVCESLDGGRTWRYLSQADEKPAPMGLWEPFMRLRAGGVVQMTYSKELAPRDQDSISIESSDGGATWSAPRTVAGGEEPALRDGMTGIASTVDQASGRDALIMIFETTRRGRTFSLEAVVSYDDGESWGHRQEVYKTRDSGANAGAPQIAAFANGGLAVVFMTDEEVPERKWPRRAGIKVLFGGPLVDGAMSWGEKEPLAVCPRPAFWPGVYAVSETRLMALCDHDGGISGRVIEWI